MVLNMVALSGRRKHWLARAVKKVLWNGFQISDESPKSPKLGSGDSSLTA